MEITFYGYEAIFNEIDRGYGHEHRCGQNADILVRQTLDYVRCLSFVRIFLTDLSGVCPLSEFCPNFCKKDCLMSFCPHFVCLEARQGRDWAVLTYGVLVRRGLMCSDTFQLQRNFQTPEKFF